MSGKTKNDKYTKVQLVAKKHEVEVTAAIEIPHIQWGDESVNIG